MNYPAHRDRYLPAMTLAEINAMPDKAKIPVVVTTGSIEQHGKHLPVCVDAMLGEAWLERSLSQLPDEIQLLVSPPITFGKSNEHSGFPGTLSVSEVVLRKQLMAIAKQLFEWGFRVLAIVNTHGGNSSLLNYTIREIQNELEMVVRRIRLNGDLNVSEQESLYGFHAGEVETSWMLEIAPGLVDMSQATCEFPARIVDPGELRPEDAPAIFSWISGDISESGVMGDATIAKAEKGKRWMEQGSQALADAFVKLSKWTAERFG
tara:strand:+ start:610 stop:1398 length:789 start_codon:yes stop_codon:yes gene_type:complete